MLSMLGSAATLTGVPRMDARTAKGKVVKKKGGVGLSSMTVVEGAGPWRASGWMGPRYVSW